MSGTRSPTTFETFSVMLFCCGKTAALTLVIQGPADMRGVGLTVFMVAAKLPAAMVHRSIKNLPPSSPLEFR